MKDAECNEIWPSKWGHHDILKVVLRSNYWTCNIGLK